MASRAELEAVTVWPAASRMAHFSLTTEGSSSTQRILAIKVLQTMRRRNRAGGCLRKETEPRAALFSSSCCAKSNPARGVHRAGVADLFGHGLGLRKQQQVIGTAGF